MFDLFFILFNQQVCKSCTPITTDFLPTAIVTKTGKRVVQGFRKLDREIQLGPDQQLQLYPKPKVYRKNWIVNETTDCYEYADENSDGQNVDHDRIRKTVWNRDIVAAKCILIKGESFLHRLHFFNLLHKAIN